MDKNKQLQMNLDEQILALAVVAISPELRCSPRPAPQKATQEINRFNLK